MSLELKKDTDKFALLRILLNLNNISTIGGGRGGIFSHLQEDVIEGLRANIHYIHIIAGY